MSVACSSRTVRGEGIKKEYSPQRGIEDSVMIAEELEGIARSGRPSSLGGTPGVRLRGSRGDICWHISSGEEVDSHASRIPFH